MSKTVYEIVKFDLKDAVLYTCKERPDLEAREDTENRYNNGRKDIRFYPKGSNVPVASNRYWELSTTPPKVYISPDERFMPYFADVTEDLPSSYKRLLKPKTYKNCQLLSQKSGGYLEFYYKPTKQTLRIAMNSHTYEPVANISKKAALS
jgi:hypothetical protein